MKNIRSLYLLVALLAVGHLAFAGGMLEGRAAKKQLMPRNEQVLELEDDASIHVNGEHLDNAVTLDEESAALPHPSAAANATSGQSHEALRLNKRDKKEMRMRARKNRKKLRSAFLQFRKHKKDKSPKSADDTELILLVILAILLPPLAVYLYEGVTTNFWIDLILTLFFWIPGVIFALIVVLR